MRALRLVLISLVVGAIGLIVMDQAAAHLSHLNSDMLYSLSLYRDIFQSRSHSWLGWILTPAPYFIPDLAFLSMIWPLTVDPGHGFVIYELLMSLAFVGVYSLILKDHDQPHYALASSLGILMALIVLVQFTLPYAEYWLFPTMHGSGILLGLTLYLFSFRKAPSARLPVVFTCFAMSLSDSLLLMQFVLPLWAILVLSRRFPLFDRTSLREQLGWETLIGVLAGGVAQKVIVMSEVFRIGSGKSLFFTNVPKSVRLFWADLPTFAPALLLSLLCLIPWLWVFKGLVRGRTRTLIIWMILTCIVSLVGPVLNGSYRTTSELRYMLPATIIPLVLMPLLGLHFIKASRRRTSLLAGGIMILPLALMSLKSPMDRSFFAPHRFHLPYPEDVACLDKLFENKPHAQGVSTYWPAKYIRELTKNHFEMKQVTPEGEPYAWITNPLWLKDKPAPDFVILNEMDEAKARDKYGEPRMVTNCSGWEVNLY